MKSASIVKAVLFAAAASGAAPSGADGVYISNPTGKPMGEDLKGAPEALHESEAQSVPVADPLPKGSSRGKKVLAAYFSWGGRTEGIAKSISCRIGADLFRIELVPAYSSEYSEVIEQSRH